MRESQAKVQRLQSNWIGADSLLRRIQWSLVPKTLRGGSSNRLTDALRGQPPISANARSLNSEAAPEPERVRRIDLMITKDERNRILEAIGKKWGPLADARGPLLVPIESRTLLLASTVSAVIDNGGFEYLLEGTFNEDEDLKQAIDAFRRIGCMEASNIIAFVMSHFLLQAGSSSLDSDERMSALDAAFPEDARNELAGRFWDQRDDIQGKIGEYILTNRPQIEEQLSLNMKEYLKKFP